jgi:tetratricopeptide (TPR) repeat protein
VILYFAVAIVAYEGAHVFLAPTTADDYMLRAAANYKLGKTDETLEALTQALKQKPDMATAYSLRGAVYLSKGNPDEAAADLTQALTFGDKTADLYVARANALFLKNDYQGALSDLNEAVRLEPKNNCYALRGIIEQKLNDPRSAVADYDRALALPMENSLASKVKVLREKAVKDLPAP